MKALAAFLAASFVAAAFAQAPKRDNPECKQPNPVFAKFPNAFTTRCERSTFAKLDIQQAKDPARVDADYTMVPKEGEYWSFTEQIVPPAGKAFPSNLEVFRNYENALKLAGGTVVGADGQRGFYYRIERPSGEYWGFVGCSGGAETGGCGGSVHRIVRTAAMQQSVVVSADQIQKSLADTGKVVFYGIYFDTDKATIKPESDPTLAEMAKFLKANAATKVFIVGHTDMQGGLERNQKLSQERAAAVVAALAGKHGIARDRMTADGVGPLAPVAANDAEAGRAKNRRVEMVLR
ncbi:MAG TPA: OmpA family protein [Usitatibacter sp.]|jgi:outer membrane protein OmpA-like peptidoglycan-associated protein|nr:OmpA family protein [Usitatibacter sp.]